MELSRENHVNCMGTCPATFDDEGAGSPILLSHVSQEQAQRLEENMSQLFSDKHWLRDRVARPMMAHALNCQDFPYFPSENRELWKPWPINNR